MSSFGLSVALLTPFAADGTIDARRMIAHAADMLDRGADGIAPFGTSGEGASVTDMERIAAIDALNEAGVPADRVTLGLCATAAATAADVMGAACDRGVTSFLLPPPFYFREAGEDGLFDWHAAVLERTDPACRVILYHIPQVTGVAISPRLTRRLRAAFPGRIQAVKDSSGEWNGTRSFLAEEGLATLVGDERQLHRAIRLGGAGAIGGVANVHPERLARVIATGEEDGEVSAMVDRLLAGPVLPGLKAMMAGATGDDGWRRVRPPLTAMARGAP